MTVTMTAATRSSLGYIMLTVTAEATDTVTSIRRSDANGSVEVRTVANFYPKAGSFQLADWETVLAGPVVYSAIGPSGILATARATMAGTMPWLINPSYPDRGIMVELVTAYAADRETGNTAHKIIDRPDPIVALGGLSTRSGVLELVTTDHAEVMRLAEFFRDPGVYFYRQPDHAGLDMFFTLDQLGDAVTETGAWIVPVTYTEVRRPSGPRNPAPRWNYEDLRAAYPTYADVINAFPTYRAVRANDPYLPGEVA